MKILVVDDSPTMRKIVRGALEDMGYSASSVIEASDGAEAMRELRDRRFEVDIILADSNMPNVDGMSLLQELKGAGHLGDIPLIMVAGEADRDRVAEAVRAGARDYIVKPFTPETLRQKVLDIERERLPRSRPTDTAMIRFEAAEAPTEPDADVPFLTQLPERLVAGVYLCAHKSEHARGEVLVEPGDVVESLHVIDRGEVLITPCRPGTWPADPSRRTTGAPLERAALTGEVRGRGECFGELSFLSGDPACAGVRARTEVTLASVGKGDFEGLLAKFPELSFHLTRVLARRARKADVKLTSELEKGLSGRFSTITLAEIVQTLHNGRKTGLLRVYQGRSLEPGASRPAGRISKPGTEPARCEEGPSEAGLVPSGSDEGDIYFVDGDVRHARTGGRTGEEAFRKLVAWAEGSFVFETGNHRIEHDVFRATMGLLMEGMVRQEEPCLSRSGPQATPAGEDTAVPEGVLSPGWLSEHPDPSGAEQE